MQDDSEPTTYGAVTPDEAFNLIGNDVRAEILRALSDERGGDGTPPTLSFSELRSRVDSEVDSSRFNYHLQQLVGRFVERREDGHSQLVDSVVDPDEGGYALRPEGTMLTRTIRAETATGEATLPRTALDLDCYFCDGTVEATYENALFKIQCADCEYLYEYDLTPPGVLDGDAETAISNASEYNRAVRLAFARGVCPLCGNGVGTTFVAPSETGYPRPDRREACINRSCDHCGRIDILRVGEALLADPGLLSFCHGHGLDATTMPIWRLEFAITDRNVTVRSTDPWEVAFRLTLDGDTLELVVDDELNVIERSRS